MQLERCRNGELSGTLTPVAILISPGCNAGALVTNVGILKDGSFQLPTGCTFLRGDVHFSFFEEVGFIHNPEK